MPFVRGQIIPEVEGAGRAKRTLDVLLWLKVPDTALPWLGELEHLRTYMGYFQPPICSIRLWVPSDQQASVVALDSFGVDAEIVEKKSDTSCLANSVRSSLDRELQVVASTALACDADSIVSDIREWLPYVEEFDKLGVLLTTPDFLLRYAEVFTRGHDLPWSFAYKAWFEPWTAFYQLSEEWTFKPGLAFLSLCQTKGASKDVVESGRSLVYNRLGDLCFTRDRLLFYDMQQAVAKRAHWKRQRFSTEVAYYLNSGGMVECEPNPQGKAVRRATLERFWPVVSR